MMPASSSSPTRPRKKSPWLAAALSLLLPGLGQIYCAQDNKGVFLVGMSLLGHWSTGGLSSCLLCPAMALDAFLIAKKINAGAEAGRWEFFPGIRWLNAVPTRVILMAIVLFIATLTVFNVLHFASGYVLAPQ